MRAFAGWLLLVSAALAQETMGVEGPTPGTVRLGDQAQVTIRIEGREADPRTPKLPVVPGLELTLSPPQRSSYTFFDGRTLTEKVGVSFVLQLRPARDGVFAVPPFPIWTGTREQMTPELRLEAKKDLRGEELAWLDVRVEPQRVYVHEPVRIAVDLGIEPGLRLVQGVHQRYRYLDVEVQAPWLDDFPGGESISMPQPTGDVRLMVANQKLQQVWFEGDHERTGQRWHRYRFERSFLPTRIGRIELSAPLLRYQVLLREGQPDVFGGRRGAQAENYYVYGKPLVLEVLPIPEQGRPTPYYGAVGRFTLDAKLDKDTVKVGGSVKLELSVRGRGNFEFLRLPELDGLDGFHKLGQAEAVRSADGVVVTYDLLPLSADVRQVPSIAWNFFDTTPGVERFVEVATPALPLVVKPLENGETLAPLADDTAAPVVPGVDDVFDLPDFDGPPRRRYPVHPWWGWAAVLGPWLLVALVAFVRRAAQRRAADPAAQRARGAARACQRSLAAGGDPLDALAAYLGDRLGVPAAAVIAPDLPQRLEAAGLAAPFAAEVAAAVERGTASRYGGGAPLAAATVLELVRRLDGAQFGKGARALLLVLPLLLLGTACGDRTGVADVAAVAAPAVASYRAGAYQDAVAAFAQSAAATADRRLWQAAGNGWFRLGDLPRARWAYENARLGLPRDAELLANLALVQRRLQLDDGAGGFLAELVALRDRFQPVERLALCVLGMLLAAGCLVLGWRRVGARWVGALVLVPATVVALDLLWWAPNRPPRAIALQKLELVSEPREGLAPVATVRPGVEVALLGSAAGTFVRVAAGDRIGFAPRAAVAVVE
ncbi:MAG: BatD family protein [Planctomycetes bacterium]|nr:BatD family protein [Planctomycetota bacterium]